MSKTAVREVEGSLILSDDEAQCSIEITSPDGTSLDPQTILDAVVDLVMHRFGVTDDQWAKLRDGGMDS